MSAPPSARPTRSTSSATSCAFDGPHAAGPVARESASVNAASSCSVSIDETRSATRWIVDGSSRSRRNATSDKQEMVRDQLREHVDVGIVEADARSEAARDLDADARVIAFGALAEVVQQRAHHQEIGTVDPCRVARRVRGRLEEMPVDGEAVVRVVLRPRAHRFPLGQDPRPDAAVVERLDHGDRGRAREQQPDEQIARLGRPRLRQRRCVLGEPFERVAVDHDALLRGQPRRAQGEQRIPGRVGVGVEMHLAVAQHDPFARARGRAARGGRSARATTSARAATRRRSSTRSRAPRSRRRP